MEATYLLETHYTRILCKFNNGLSQPHSVDDRDITLPPKIFTRLVDSRYWTQFNILKISLINKLNKKYLFLFMKSLRTLDLIFNILKVIFPTYYPHKKEVSRY